jgi:glycosyltransferase involved in cell wall biosynthesis
MKKILILADANSNHTRKWARILQSQGHQISIFSLYPILDSWNKENNISVTSFFRSSIISRWKKPLYIFAVFRIARLISHIKPQIINAHYASSYGLLGALKTQNNLYLNFWGSDVFVFPKKNLLNRLILKWIIKRSTKVFSSSLIMTKEISLYSSKSVETINFGIDTQIYMPKSIKIIDSSKVIKIGIIKSLEPIYRIDLAINALIWLQKNTALNLELHICGSGSIEHDLKLISNDSVFFNGKIEQNSVPSFLQSMDIFLNTTEFESFGMSTIEAMACGVPVVAHNSGGASEIINHNVTGILYAPNEVENVAKALLELLINPNNAKNIAEQGRLCVQQNYELSKISQKIKAFY